MFDENIYEDNVSSFKNITSSEGDELLGTENKVVMYIGRETCPYCNRFVKKLSKVASQVDDTIYYVDSSNYTDSALDAFRDKYNIITVPGFIVKKNDDFDVRCDSSIPEEEILNMIQ